MTESAAIAMFMHLGNGAGFKLNVNGLDVEEFKSPAAAINWLDNGNMTSREAIALKNKISSRSH
jgi:hypothetical protein